MNNLLTKFEVPRPKHSLMNDQKAFGLQTDLLTDKWKAIYPHFFEEGVGA
jgi:hypothetical protein